MRKPAGMALAAVVLVAGTGCKRLALGQNQAVPPGTVVFQFTKKVLGPLELSLDGNRIPVAQGSKGGKKLVVRGLAAGKHRYFLSSPRDAFGPDLGDLELPADKGVHQITLSQRFNAVLYGNPEPMPPAEGMAGVSASLEP